MTSKEAIEVRRILKWYIKILLNSSYGITAHETEKKVKEWLKGK